MSADGSGNGPLAGVRVLEIGGMGPAPFAGMTLAELGCEVVRVERPGGPGVFPGTPRQDVHNRGKQSIVLDLKREEAVEALLTMVESADVLIEGHRPGVSERLGIGPKACWERNPRLVYGRMTGWGQTGPLSAAAGHDINYISVTGALHAIGSAGGPPQVPLNLVGDFGGGGMYLLVGVLAALHEAGRTGRGQVVDAAIVDGVSHLLTGIHSMVNSGTWADERGVNMLDGGAPYYGVYETFDGRYMAVGAYENKFYAQLLASLQLDEYVAVQNDRTTWTAMRDRMAQRFLERTQAEWVDLFADTDACATPVLSLREAAEHPHMRDRAALVTRDGLLQSAAAPRFSAHEAPVTSAPPLQGQHTKAALTAWGVPGADGLIARGVAVQSE